MKSSISLLISFTLSFTLSFTSFSQTHTPKKLENIIYGLVSGTALLMDVYVPDSSNQKAIVLIPGSSFGYVYDDVYDQYQLKDDMTLDSLYMGKWGMALMECGYTLFVINHRFTPRYQYKDIIEDCRRAVRYIRYYADAFHIDPTHIGAMGLSSGGNLAAMLGVTDGQPSVDASPVDSVSSRVQAVVTLAGIFDLSDFNKAEDAGMKHDYMLSVLTAYIGSLPVVQNGSFVLSSKYMEASPVAHITSDDAPILFYYSDNDPLIPTRQANAMYEKLVQNDVAAKLVLSPGTGHAPIPEMTEVCAWFNVHLKATEKF
jgi:acetyl esterase/lipase